MKYPLSKLIDDEWYYTSRFLYRFKWFRKSIKTKWTKVKWKSGRVYWLPLDKNILKNFDILDSEDWN